MLLVGTCLQVPVTRRSWPLNSNQLKNSAPGSRRLVCGNYPALPATPARGAGAATSIGFNAYGTFIISSLTVSDWIP